MTRTMILILQSVEFGKDDLLALNIFIFLLRWKTNIFKSYGNPSPYEGIYKVPLLGLSDLSQLRLR